MAEVVSGFNCDGNFSVRVHSEDSTHIVALSGDLDLASHASAIQACTSPDFRDVVVDLADLAFMDSAGYSALVASRAILERRGGSLLLADPVGEPLRLLTLFEHAGGDSGSAPRRSMLRDTAQLL